MAATKTAFLTAAAIFCGFVPPAARGQCELHETTKLIAADAGQADQFGTSAAVSGDLAVFGAYGDNFAGAFTGSAYLFRQVGDTWQQIAKLTADDAAESDFFGWSVAVDSDTVIVGAYGNDDSGASSGSAYVFREVGGAWQQIAKLVAADAAAGDEFGYSAAISGDTVVIGARRDDSAVVNSGSAYVFREVAGTWQQIAKLTAADAGASDVFGTCVAISGDTIAAGAFGDSGVSAYTGSVYFFRESGGVWQQIAKRTVAADDFGVSVALRGDTAIVGAYGDITTGTNRGSAYVFREIGGVWQQIAKLTAADGAAEDYFAHRVDFFGDTAVIGAYRNDDTFPNSGCAYVFREIGGTWQQVAKLTATDPGSSDEFGWSVAVSEHAALVGARWDDEPASNTGSVYVFDLTQALRDCNSNGVPDDCDNCADLDGDGLVDAVDYQMYRDAHGQSAGDLAYDPCADYDGSGAVGLVDFQAWLACYRDFVGDPLASPPGPEIPSSGAKLPGLGLMQGSESDIAQPGGRNP